VSTEEQATRGFSLDAQEEELHAQAAVRKVKVKIIRVPGHTGSRMSPRRRNSATRSTSWPEAKHRG
jgi:hypothetical protein